MAIYLTQGDGGDETRVDEIEGKLKSTIPDLKRVSSVEAIDPKSVNGSERSIVVLAAAAPQGANVDDLIDVVRRHPRSLFFIVVGGDISAQAYKRLIQSGNADWVADAGLPHEVLDIVGRVSAPVRDDVAADSPVVVSFTPSAGGVGNSTLAIETAVQVVRAKSTKGAKVALVDLDFQSSHVCDYLDIAPKFQFEEIVAAPDRLDDHLLSAFISHHACGLDVLAASRSRFHARDLSVEALSALFDRMAQRYSTIIIDLPLSVHSWTLPLLAASKGILVTGLNTIPGLRQIEETLRALREEATITAEVRALVNRCDVGFLGKVARADHVSRILGEEKHFCVRNAAVAVECVNVGTPIALAYPSDKSVRDIAAVAAFCVRPAWRPAPVDRIKPMGFLNSKSVVKSEPTIADKSPEPPSARPDDVYADLIARRPGLLDEKLKLHERIIDEFNLTALEKLPDELAKQVRAYVGDHVRRESLSLNQKELDIFSNEIIAEMTGYGPLEPLLKDPTVTDILINTHKRCYIERFGQLQEAKVHFKDEAHLLRIINRIVSAIGRRVDESSPMVDARLRDGSRVNVAVRPIAVDGPLVSIRKFAERVFDMDRLIEVGSLRPAIAEVLAAAVAGKVSTLIAGGTGSGKTTMLNALSNFIPSRERLITIEDAAELQLQQPHVGRLETRPANIEGKGEVRQRDLVRNALRMRPDRIIIGECRGEEAFDMLQAMNTGHEGSMTTVHANSPRDALKRLEQMVGMAGTPMTLSAIRSQIASAITLVVQVQRLPDGARRLTSVSEITGMEGEIIQMHEIFKFVKDFTDGKGTLHGSFKATGIRPRFLADVKAYGIDVSSNCFDPARTL